MNFFQRLGWKLRQWMQGRYGTDALNLVLVGAGLVCSLFGRNMVAGVFDAGAAAHVFAQHPGAAAGKRMAFGPVSPSGRRQDAQALPLPQVSSKGARAARQGKDPDHLPQVRREIYKKDLRVIAIARELDIIKLEFTKRSDF